ncbi:hypothetical protein SAMN05428974_2303 [Sphingopyxis sp. YR583]|uniref:hypothetical protein n=1 Tax=Sphingopyxis sp. YR583 TaxID=1881047 RepID=UPI0008A78C5C|nr:hypothetical protein [Sphingopyxis sp. YR583]SEH17714.1 hypothetical protein SAMN05428974_2303 [Sphingopyxis sp. YR583]
MDHSLARKLLLASAILLVVGGCGSRHFSSRSTNPLIEDRVRMGDSGEQKMSVLTSRADRRTILVFGEEKICAEPSPDVAEAVYSQTAASAAQKETKVEFSSTLQTALMQLSRRSQGLDFYRTGAFVNCMMYYNGVFKDRAEYAAEMAELRETSIALTEKELAHLPEIMKAVVQVSHAATAAAAAAENDGQPAAAGAADKQ